MGAKGNLDEGHSLLVSLLYDLERRCTLVKQRLSALDDPDTRTYVFTAYQDIELMRRDIVALRADPTLGWKAFQRNQFAQYRLRKQRLLIHESYTLPFVERYNATDRRLTRLCQQLLAQVRWPLPPPLITAFSSQYYWVPSAANFIAAPATETMSLLGLPDMCHELGHLLWREHHETLVGEFVNEVLDYIREQLHRIDVEQRPPGLRQDFEQLSVLWQGKWLQEFVADIVAVYLIGPAFGWQNTFLCAETDRSVFTPALGESNTHPADAARHTGILATLTLLGNPEGVKRVSALWDEYLAWSGEVVTGQYSVCYPNHLIVSLAAKVVAGCQRLGIRAYVSAPILTEVLTELPDMVALVHEAWEQQLRAPEGYHKWEQERIVLLESLSLQE